MTDDLDELERLADEAAKKADNHFADRFSELTKLNDDELQAIILETGISKQNLKAVLREVKSATASNEAKARSIQNIDKGVSVLVSLAKRFV